MVRRGLREEENPAHTPAQMREAIRDGVMHLWAAEDESGVVAGMIFSLIDYPSKRVVFVEMVAGCDMNEWFDKEFHLLRKFCALNNADTIEAYCRDGMVRFLAKRGWKRRAVIMEAPDG